MKACAYGIELILDFTLIYRIYLFQGSFGVLRGVGA
jgi:hypothetical protein